MSMIIGLSAVMFNWIMALRRINAGLFVFVVLAIVFPVIRIGGTALSYDLVCFVGIFLIFLMKKPRYTFTVIDVFYLSLLTLLILSSFVSHNLYHTPIVWTQLTGSLRFYLIYVLMHSLFRDTPKTFYVVMKYILLTNLFAIAIQMTFPDSVTLFHYFYSKETLTPLSYFVEIGRFTRGTGTFGSPLNLSVVALIAFTYLYAQLLKYGYDKRHLIYFIVSVAVGLASLSKLFIIGAPVILSIGVLLKMVFNGKIKLSINISTAKSIGLISVLVATLVVLFVRIADKMGFFIMYYLGYLLKPFDAFATRYSSSEGNLNAAFEVFLANPLIGVGNTVLHGEFMGDSAYVILLHDTGFAGLLLLIGLYSILFYSGLKQKNYHVILFLTSIIFSGFAYPVLFSLYGGLILAMLQTLRANPIGTSIGGDRH